MIPKDTLKAMNDTHFLSTGTGTTATAHTFLWSNPERVAVIEKQDSIEFIYKEVSTCSLTVYPPPPALERVFKIVFSCVDGKWNKSERIYGNIVPAQPETYIFTDVVEK